MERWTLARHRRGKVPTERMQRRLNRLYKVLVECVETSTPTSGGDLAVWTGIPYSTVIRYLYQMQACGWITITNSMANRESGCSLDIIVHRPEKWRWVNWKKSQPWYPKMFQTAKVGHA